jgi:hypothetical protein
MNFNTERRALLYRVFEFTVCWQFLELPGELSEAIKVLRNIKVGDGKF